MIRYEATNIANNTSDGENKVDIFSFQLSGLDTDFDINKIRLENIETVKERYNWAGKYADKRANTYLRFWHYGMLEGSFNKKKDRHIGLGGWVTNRSGTDKLNPTTQTGIKGRDIFIPFHHYHANVSLIEDIRKSELNARKKGWNGGDPFYTTFLPEDLPNASLIYLDWDFLMRLYIDDKEINNLLNKGNTYNDICFQNGFYRAMPYYNIRNTLHEIVSRWRQRKDKYTPEVLARLDDLRNGMAVTTQDNNRTSLMGCVLAPGRMNTPELYPMDTRQYPHFNITYPNTNISRFVDSQQLPNYYGEVSDERWEEIIAQSSARMGKTFRERLACINPYCYRIHFPNGDKWIPSQGMVRK